MNHFDIGLACPILTGAAKADWLGLVDEKEFVPQSLNFFLRRVSKRAKKFDQIFNDCGNFGSVADAPNRGGYQGQHQG